MNDTELIAFWKAEENAAHIHGWDFSHIAGRYSEETDLPWSYEEIVRKYLKPDMRILDVDTGGGEFLLSLGHPYKNTAAMEAYLPNIDLCRQTLLPLGIDFRPGDGKGDFPFESGIFDIVLNRHGDMNIGEISRVLKKGGVFISEQVGAENDRELVGLLLGKTKVPFPEQYLCFAKRKFQNEEFEIFENDECFRPIRFYDVGALVWFSRIIEWEFPGFSVESCEKQLFEAQKIIDSEGFVEGRIHRFVFAAGKK
ncbi:MAG: methyltransferase domain-containing protein [Firmicutes bacterium]|nr:methyltransferase domain-containing protein [Bacillota bacterium]